MNTTWRKVMAEEYTDAIALLKADHRKVETLFEKFETAGDKAKKDIAHQICVELKIHTLIEEEIFYQRGVEIVAAPAHEKIDAGAAIFGPGVDRDVRFGEHRHAGHAHAGAERMQPHFEQSRAGGRGGIDQAALDMIDVVEPARAAQVGDQMLALIIPGHNRLSCG
jgi:uncharacterized protein YdcH (DUF465 family)